MRVLFCRASRSLIVQTPFVEIRDQSHLARMPPLAQTSALLALGADPTLRDDEDDSAWDWANKTFHGPLIKKAALIQQMLDPNRAPTRKAACCDHDHENHGHGH